MDPPEVGTREVGAGKHSLLGRHFKSAQSETHYWEGTLDSTLPYLDDHRIEGVAVLPAAVYLEMAFAAAAEAFPSHSFTLKDVSLLKALFIAEGETRATQLVLSPNADATSSVHIYSRANENESWTLHATASLCPDLKPAIEQESLRESLAQLENSMHRTDLGRGPLPETPRSRRHLWPLLPDRRGPVARRQRNNRRAESAR